MRACNRLIYQLLGCLSLALLGQVTLRSASADVAQPALPPSPLTPEIAKNFTPDAPIVGEVNGTYIDPEFSEGASQVVFQDAQNLVWIGDLDANTGKFKTATGRDYLIDANITPVFDKPPRKWSTNGPEWAKDEKGHCVVYTREDQAGLMQQWQARLVDGKAVVTKVTAQPMDCYGNMPSRFEDGKPSRIAFTYNWPLWKAQAAWVYANNPDELHTVPGFDYNRMSMWSPVSADFLFVHRPKGAACGQIGRADADTGKITILTNDEGEKDDPGFFKATEFGGEICLMANVDNKAIAIYRDLHAPDGFWTRVATLTLPDNAPYHFISSPEIIAPSTGVDGVSYLTLLARQNKERNSPGSIWVLGLGTDPDHRLVRRIDDAAVTGTKVIEMEPEPFVGKNEAYVYYNFYDLQGGKHGLRRASTGITVISAEIVKTADIPYAKGDEVEQKYLSLDIHAPKEAKKAPVVVYIHGGYWQAGDKREVGHLPAFFGKAGYLLASVNYRLAPQAVHPTQVQDIARAVAWVHAHIVEYGGDPTQIYLTGHSAGAHLVALLGTDVARLQDVGQPLSVLRAVIPLDSAAMDIRTVAANDRRPDSPYRAAFGADPATWADASPLMHAATGKDLPLFLLVVAYGPGLKNKKQGINDFAAAVRKSGTHADIVDASLFREHQSLMTEFGATDDPVSKTVLSFIESVRHGKMTAGKGTECVLAPENMSIEEATQALEAYRTRIMMKLFDKNGDKRIAREEMLAQPYLFGRMDADNNAVITADELTAYYQREEPLPKPTVPMPETPPIPAPAVWKPVDTRIGTADAAYLDPEILQSQALMVFADGRGTVWVGELDPITGKFKSADGCDFRIDENLSKWSRYSNGPEWGLDARGPAIFYLKDNAQGAGQLWRATAPWDAPQRTQLTRDTEIHNWICAPTIHAGLPTTRVIIYRGKPGAAGNVDAWIDEEHPDVPTAFTPRMVIARWAYNTSLITWAPKPTPRQKTSCQVTLVDTEKKTATMITADAGNKIDPWLWQAPEFGGELLLCVIIDGQALGIYRDTKHDGTPWQRIATLTLPADAPHKTLKSVEPVNGGVGAFGHSYFTAQGGDDKDIDTSIWLFGFDPTGKHLVRRLDEGGQTGKHARRLDPETLVGAQELFVYYTLIDNGPAQLRLCRTGITVEIKGQE